VGTNFRGFVQKLRNPRNLIPLRHSILPLLKPSGTESQANRMDDDVTAVIVTFAGGCSGTRNDEIR